MGKFIRAGVVAAIAAGGSVAALIACRRRRRLLVGRLFVGRKLGLLTLAEGIAVDETSRVYVFGSPTGCADGSSSGDFAVIRFTATGDVDTAFGVGGYR